MTATKHYEIAYVIHQEGHLRREIEDFSFDNPIAERFNNKNFSVAQEFF